MREAQAYPGRQGAGIRAAESYDLRDARPLGLQAEARSGEAAKEQSQRKRTNQQAACLPSHAR